MLQAEHWKNTFKLRRGNHHAGSQGGAPSTQYVHKFLLVGQDKKTVTALWTSEHLYTFLQGTRTNISKWCAGGHSQMTTSICFEKWISHYAFGKLSSPINMGGYALCQPIFLTACFKAATMGMTESALRCRDMSELPSTREGVASGQTSLRVNSSYTLYRGITWLC